MTEENKQMLAYINYQMKHGVSFESICNNYGFYKKEDIQDLKICEEQISLLRKENHDLRCCGNCNKNGCFSNFGMDYRKFKECVDNDRNNWEKEK